jgi:hypothetical protein
MCEYLPASIFYDPVFCLLSYEEKSLGIFEEPPEDEDEEPTLDDNVSRPERIGKYVGWHLRRQIAFDIWWLVWGIWLICIIERGKLMDPAKVSWFNIFRISKPYYKFFRR